jgi:hypothetical protein
MKAVCMLALAVFFCADTALAHHSYAMFDVKKTLSLTGTVKDWQWTNPHTWLVLVAPGPEGEGTEWNIESSSPAIWRHYGGNRDMVKSGDRVTVVMHPLRSGAIGGELQAITTADGKTYDLSQATP